MACNDGPFDGNSNPKSLIGVPGSNDQSRPTYGLDKDTIVEANDGSTMTLGDLIAGAGQGGSGACVNIADVTVTTKQVDG